ncbi:MAG: adenylate/guanylate cyclase domain-containing protein [Actinomycetota bacterium]
MRCGNCDHENPPEAKFCMECGRETGVTAIPSRSTLDVTPPHLAEKIRRSGSELVGEHKQVTVLFADVTGSMELQEGVDPDTWHTIMDRFFTIMCEGISRFEGTVNKFTGDGIMALFGAPIAHEDHAQRACYAALHLAESLSAYALELRRERGLNFHVRMGVNSGEVVVGAIGADLRMDYTALGHTVGLASRVEQLAEPGKAYLTEYTAEFAKGYFELEDLGEFSIKGVSRPIKVYELAGIGTARSRLDIARARGFSRFVGRAREMNILEEALERAMAGEGSVIGVVAEPGVGKSRLCYEFAEQCRARGLFLREARGVSHGKGIPFLPVMEMLRAFFEITDADPDDKAREKVAGRLVLLDPNLMEWLSLLFDFMGIGDPANPPPRMDPEARLRRLFALVKDVVHARSRKEPGVLILEDLHWIDPGSAAFLATLIDAVPGTRTLIVANFRPEYRADWMKESNYRAMPIEPLGPAAIDQLLTDLLGSDPSLTQAVEKIRDRTAGNPFFVEELVQALAESGSLVGERGAYRLGGPLDDHLVPRSVEAVLGARIDRLGEREKSILQTAAVIGREFPEPVLQRVWAGDDAEIGPALAALVGAEFLFEVTLYPEAVYTFKHPLSHEVAYRSQLGERRASVHRAVAEALVELYPDKLEENSALISHHFELAGDMREAARWSATAATWVGRSDHGEAVRRWQRVRSLVAGLPEDDESQLLKQLSCVQALAHGWRLGLPREETDDLVTQGQALAERRGDLASQAIVAALDAGLKGIHGDIAAGYERAVEADAIAEQVDPTLRLVVGPALAYLGLLSGRIHDALDVVDRLMASPPTDPMVGADLLYFSPYIWMFGIRAVLLAYTGQLDKAAEHAERGLALARENNDLENAGWSHGIVAQRAWFTGDPSFIGTHPEQSVEIAERIGSSFSQVIAFAQMATAHVLRENHDAAIEAAQRAISIARERGVGFEWTPYVLEMQAQAYLALGDPRARATAEEALSLARQIGGPIYECQASRVLGRILLRTGAYDEAEAALSHAMTLIHSTGAVGIEPMVREELAELARLTGDEKKHERELREAHRLYAKMGAAGHLARLDPLVSSLS